MNFLIVGQNSYLGKNLRKELAKEYNQCVWGINRCVNPACSHNIENIACVDQNGFLLTLDTPIFDVVYLLATKYSKNSSDEAEIEKVNVAYLFNIMKSLSHKSEIFVYSNSYLALSNPKASKRSKYAQTKEEFANLALEFATGEKKIFHNLYLYDIVGPLDPRKKIFSSIDESIRFQECLDLSEGNQLIWPTNIADVVDALIRIPRNELQNSNYQIRISSGLTLREYVFLYCELKNIRPKLNWGARPYFGDELFELIDNPPNYLHLDSTDYVKNLLKSVYNLH